MKIERNGDGAFEVYLDRVVGSVKAHNARELMATIEHYYRPEGYRQSHVNWNCRGCPLCALCRERSKNRGAA
jgi:hypothetical protein